LIRERPFRAPHQTVSAAALVGGGSDPKPGEISLAHRGILFLDELPEFQRNVLDALRQPIESGSIRIARAKGSVIFPARFILAAAMNPCPCGYHGDAEKECRCSAHDVIKYQKRISGPLLDRIDLQIKIGRIKIAELRGGESLETTNVSIKIAIERTREIQRKRFVNDLKTNAEMSARETQKIARLEKEAEGFLGTLEKNHLSPRSYYRLLKVARTIADLGGQECISREHLAEAFSYRFREDS
jgi:magnesium chelatase family protein